VYVVLVSVNVDPMVITSAEYETVMSPVPNTRTNLSPPGVGFAMELLSKLYTFNLISAELGGAPTAPCNSYQVSVSTTFSTVPPRNTS